MTTADTKFLEILAAEKMASGTIAEIGDPKHSLAQVLYGFTAHRLPLQDIINCPQGSDARFQALTTSGSSMTRSHRAAEQMVIRSPSERWDLPAAGPSITSRTTSRTEIGPAALPDETLTVGPPGGSAVDMRKRYHEW